MKINVELDEKEYNGAKYREFLEKVLSDSRSLLLLSEEKDLEITIGNMGKSLLHMAIDREMVQDFFGLMTMMSVANSGEIAAMLGKVNRKNEIDSAAYLVECLDDMDKIKLAICYHGEIMQRDLGKGKLFDMSKSMVSIIVNELKAAGLIKIILAGKFHKIRAEEKLINEVRSDEKMRKILDKFASAQESRIASKTETLKSFSGEGPEGMRDEDSLKRDEKETMGAPQNNLEQKSVLQNALLKLEEYIAEGKINAKERVLYNLLLRDEKGIPQAELRIQSEIASPSNFSHLLKEMVREGYIRVEGIRGKSNTVFLMPEKLLKDGLPTKRISREEKIENALRENGGKLSQTELCVKTSIDPTHMSAVLHKMGEKITRKSIVQDGKNGRPQYRVLLNEQSQADNKEDQEKSYIIARKIMEILHKNGKRMPQKIIADTLKTTDADIDSAIKVINNNGGLKITKEILHQKSPEIKEVCMITLLG